MSRARVPMMRVRRTPAPSEAGTPGSTWTIGRASKVRTPVVVADGLLLSIMVMGLILQSGQGGRRDPVLQNS